MALRDRYDRQLGDKIDRAAAKIKDPRERAKVERQLDTLRDQGNLSALNRELRKRGV